MYICVCNAVTERDIGSAVARGCGTLRQLREQLGVGECCGRCAGCARALLKDAQQERIRHSPVTVQMAPT